MTQLIELVCVIYILASKFWNRKQWDLVSSVLMAEITVILVLTVGVLHLVSEHTSNILHGTTSQSKKVPIGHIRVIRGSKVSQSNN